MRNFNVITMSPYEEDGFHFFEVLTVTARNETEAEAKVQEKITSGTIFQFVSNSQLEQMTEYLQKLRGPGFA